MKLFIKNLSFALVAVFLLSVPGMAFAKVTCTAVISTVAPDYSGSAHSVISVEPVGGPRGVQNNLLPASTSDITVAAHKNFFYRMERFNADNITKFDIAAPSTPVWQFSTMDEGETVSSNPHDILFVSSEKAYILRYGSTKAWIVNPSATTQDKFKIGELDLGAYADSDGVPEMNSGVIGNDKLFIALQRLDRDNGWIPSNISYIAVFDTNTDKEIDTATPNDDGVKGIAMPIKNPGAIQYLKENGMVYVQGAGDYGSSWTGRAPEYSGGIVSINPDTYEVNMVVDDGDDDDHPYGNISGMAIASKEKGYFVGYAGWGDNTLYAFNPSTGQVFGPANDDLKNKNIAGMEAGAYVDANNMLWVCDSTDGQVVILNTKDDSIDEKISTELNPTRVVFTSEGEPDPVAPVSDGGSGGCFIKTTSGSIHLSAWIFMLIPGFGLIISLYGNSDNIK